MASSHWNDLDDSSSVCGSLLSTSTLSFTPGPGARTGKFLKLLGEKSLDFVVRVVIRSRLAAIEHLVETSPQVFYNPTEDKEWKMMLGAYRDLRELCRESQSYYYPSSFQSIAARLVRDITNMIQSAPQDSFTKDLAGVGRWEELLARVQIRWEVVVTRKVETYSAFVSFHPGTHLLEWKPSMSNNGRSDRVDIETGLDRRDADETPHRDSRQMSNNCLEYSEAFPQDSFPAPPFPDFPTRQVLVLGAGATAGKPTSMQKSASEIMIDTLRRIG